MSKRMIDVVLNIDSLQLSEEQTVDSLIDYLRGEFEFGYEPTYEILYEELVDDD